jgi:hypothetical protein
MSNSCTKACATPPSHPCLPRSNKDSSAVLPYLSEKAATKYLPPSSAMSKGHMKQPCKGLQSTTPNQPCIGVPASVPDPVMPGLFNPFDHDEDNNLSDGNPHFNIIDNVNNHSIANIFCFGTFSDKITSIVYNDCTGNFPFMSLNGNVCFL